MHFFCEIRKRSRRLKFGDPVSACRACFRAIIAFALVCVPPPSGAGELPIAEFSTRMPGGELPEGWKPLTFKDIARHTRYALVEDGGTVVLKAASEASASGLIREIRVDTLTYPWLEWRWKAENVLRGGDVTRKAGDDYPARIYVTFAYDPDTLGFGERLKAQAYRLFYGQYPPTAAISYIWASHSPVGTEVPNAYTDRVRMVVVDSGDAGLGEWVSHARNVHEDYVRLFGGTPPAISGIAIMTDTDNTGESATAYFGDIRFRQSVP